MNEVSRNPELHVNEEPRNDFLDVGVGFIGAFILFTVIAVVMGIFAQYI